MLKKFFAFAAMFVAMVVSSTAFAMSVAHPADGIYSIQPKCAPGKELSVQNRASNWGANVIIDNISSNCRWKVQRIGNTDFYSIIAVHSNLALDVANAQATNGVNIATWPFLEGKQNQYIFWDAGGGYYVIQANIGGSFVVDVDNGENRAGANVLSWSFVGGDNQKWKLVPVQLLSTFQSFSKQATQTVNAYVMPDLSSRTGNERVDRGDNVTVLREEGNAYLVRYPVSGGTKTRWVNKNEIFGNVDGGDSSGGPANVPANLQSLINTYNNKTWKDHTYLKNVKQCKEFASFIFNKLYGVGYIGGGSVSSNAKNYLINLANPNRVALRGYRTNLTAQSARELFQSAQPGDFVQIRRRHGGPHSGIFINRTSDGIILFEANADGKNSIRTNTYSYSDLANKNFAMSLYCAK